MKNLIKRVLPESLRRSVLTKLNRLWVAFCCLLPVKNRVLFYTIRSDGKLLDNAAALYDALDCDKVIFAHKLPHSKSIKPRAYRLILTSRVIVTDDYCRYMRAVKLREGQRLLQIWHACGAFKCFGLDADTDLSEQEERSAHSQYTAVAVTGPECVKAYAGAFGIDESRCIPLGMPRTDILVNEPDKLRNEFLSRHPELKGKKVYSYFPTFREKNGERVKFNPGIDFAALSESLDDSEIFVIKRHPLEEKPFTDKEYKGIIDLSGESADGILSVSAVHITDYSSTVYDATLLGVPSVYYCPDLDTYERNFYLEFPDDLPGVLVRESGDILSAAREIKKNPPVSEMENFRNRQMSACDGHSAEREKDLIMSWL